MDRLPAVMLAERVRRTDGPPAVMLAERVRRMHRWLAAMLAAAALVACDSKADKSAAEPPHRTDGAKVNLGQAVTTDAFCDRHATGDGGAAFRWPELAAGSTAPEPPTTWRWVNVWATWC